MDKSALKEIEKTVEKILQEMNTELVAMEYVRDHKSLVLRIFIDNENGVDMELCTRATKAVKAKIDETDISYDQLEVSSPGLDRVLKKDKDFIRFQGHQVKIKTPKEFEGPRTIVGILEAADENHIKLKTDEKTFDISRQYITSARLKPEV